MIEIQGEALIYLAMASFLAGSLLTLSIFVAIMLRRISKEMKDLADKMEAK